MPPRPAATAHFSWRSPRLTRRSPRSRAIPCSPIWGIPKARCKVPAKALAILESLARTDPENQQVRLALAATHQQISDLLDFSGDTAGAVAQSGDALKIYDGLAASLATDLKFQTERVIQTYHYANLLNLTGALDESAAQYRQAVELSQRIIAANPSRSRKARFIWRPVWMALETFFKRKATLQEPSRIAAGGWPSAKN